MPTSTCAELFDLWRLLCACWRCDSLICSTAAICGVRKENHEESRQVVKNVNRRVHMYTVVPGTWCMYERKHSTTESGMALHGAALS